MFVAIKPNKTMACGEYCGTIYLDQKFKITSTNMYIINFQWSLNNIIIFHSTNMYINKIEKVN
jgi:hypothetical protein